MRYVVQYEVMFIGMNNFTDDYSKAREYVEKAKNMGGTNITLTDNNTGEVEKF